MSDLFKHIGSQKCTKIQLMNWYMHDFSSWIVFSMRGTILPADPSWLSVGVDIVGVECSLSAFLPVYFCIKNDIIYMILHYKYSKVSFQKYSLWPYIFSYWFYWRFCFSSGPSWTCTGVLLIMKQKDNRYFFAKFMYRNDW